MKTAALTPLSAREADASYTAWVQAKVQAALADSRPTNPHTAVMAEIRAMIAAAQARHPHVAS